MIGESTTNEGTNDRGDRKAENRISAGWIQRSLIDSHNTDETKVLSSIVQRGKFGDDDHSSTEQTCSSDTSDGSTEDQDVHGGGDTADERSDLEDEDGEHHDVFGGEDLGPLGVDQVKAEKCEAVGNGSVS